MRRTKRWMTAILALALLLAQGVPARAGGLFGWLFGGDGEAVEASAEVTPLPADMTLPPAEALRPSAASTPEIAATPEVASTPAPIPDATLEDDGMLRVELRSLDYPAQLHLTLAGVYAVEGDPGFRFDRDTRIALSAAGEDVYLAVGGLTLNMGASVTLTRHLAQEGMENGLYIDESEKEALYCGDLTVSVAAENALRAVLRVQVEEYLYGVVGYEMNDAFPLEALKAQAVAARTYALRRKSVSANRDYDVVDTTADQVYKGYIADYANVVRAVDETRGVVGLYDGNFASCYFTASNGGQTALASHAFDRPEDDAYLAMTDDPYDLENPLSLQNELTVGERCEGSDALKGMLEAALGKKLGEMGYGDGEWEFESIESVEPADPRFEGSRMYDGLKFGLWVKLLTPVATPTPEPAETPVPAETAGPGTADILAAALIGNDTPAPTDTPEPTPEPTRIPREWRRSDAPVEVTLSVFDDIKDGLKLGLNKADYELISVETRERGQFTLIMRRFGHGAGMSQRGAQRMAGVHGIGWQQILAFYYPGLSFERMRWPDETMTDLAALPDGVGAARPRPTPTPTPAPLPALKDGERYAVVNATALNVREKPTTASQALDQLMKGRKVIVSGEPDADGWVPIHTAELEGFVKAEYLDF